MKKYRALVPVVLIVLMVVSWYMLIHDAVTVESSYKNYLSEARKYAEDGITKYAIENYNLALEIKQTPEIYSEVSEYYKAQGKNAEYLSWCENFFETFPTNAKAYDCVLDAYLTDKDYKSCYDVLETASQRHVSSDYIKQVSTDILYVYKLDFNTYEDVRTYSNNYSPVKSKGLWGFVDRYGNQRIGCKYKEVGAYTQSNFASVLNSDDEAYFIDKSGSKVLVAKEKFKYFGLLVDGKIAAQKSDGKYVYVDQDFNTLFGNYDFASTINEDVAVVKNEDNFEIIDGSGKVLTNAKYIDVKLDEKQIAYRNGRLFVATSAGKYIMIDKSGKQVGDLTFEDARVFLGDAPAAVKLNGKWCFVNADGKLVSDKTYDDARSFSNGLAAVCIDGKWGFVDEGENIAIEPAFFDAKDFNNLGSCFVKTGDKWQLLKLFRLNREE